MFQPALAIDRAARMPQARGPRRCADLTIWRRTVPPIADALDALLFDELPDLRLEGPAHDIVASLIALAELGDLPASLAWVYRDAAALVRRFVSRDGSGKFAARLEPVATDACKLLHHDYVPLRLVCTYRGPGTEWLPRAHEAKVGAERRDVPPGLLRIVPRFAPALFTGRLNPGARPLLHRSPRFAGDTRLVLTVNAVIDPT